jgi:hypothetical protein
MFIEMNMHDGLIQTRYKLHCCLLLFGVQNFSYDQILHLGQGSFTRIVRTIFTLKIIVSIFVKLYLILVLHLRHFFNIRYTL